MEELFHPLSGAAGTAAACAAELVGLQIPWELGKPIKGKGVGALKYNAIYMFSAAFPPHIFFIFGI